ncbi:AMP-binding protein [Palleronia caenipelagi]|uniref:3-methylmercaptopropionyl-CoA ligase n=1 Tax=Palleronia caenipelagi TaxID=2489174 RepID=A0A547Q763_9RHOB|nr:AMP-binding protein [Palleronia caenipelagi]TRD22209.1 AMP-binding protein [Palleronia caenipelagi]
MRENFEALERNPANHVPLSPVSFLRRAARVHRDDIATVQGETRRSWAEVHDRVCRVAGGLRARGIGVGDTVTVLSGNLPELFELHFAVPMAGAVLSALNTRLEPATIAYILDHSDSQLLMVSSDLVGLAQAALEQSERAPEIVEIPLSANAAPMDHPGYDDLLAGPPLDVDGLPEDEWQALALNYTSGTSGRPKGVVYHHRGAYLMALGTVAAWQVPRKPVYLSVVPMFHCNGWGHPWMMAILGGTVVFPASTAPEALFEAIRAEGVTHFGAAPVVLQMLAESEAAPSRRIDPALQVMTAGAPPPPAVLQRMASLGMEVMHVYGLTETYGHISQCLPQEDWRSLDPAEEAARRARQGVPFPMVEEVAVIDRETGQSVPADAETQGEIAIRGNTVMKGYYKDPDATAEAMQNGYFWSGDGAVLYPDGYMQIRDRLKDVIISGGENVSSVEVEAVLYAHPAVQTAAVVARPDPKWGEVPCAFVELRPGHEADEAGIMAFCRDRLAGFKTPKSVIFAEIPKTSTGKIQKFELRQRIKDMG